MQFDQERAGTRPQLAYRGRVGSRAQQLIFKTLAFAGTGAIFVSAIAISIVVFALALTAVFVLGGYLWWKTRAARRHMRARPAAEGVIEGFIVREAPAKRLDELKVPAKRLDEM